MRRWRTVRGGRAALLSVVLSGTAWAQDPTSSEPPAEAPERPTADTGAPERPVADAPAEDTELTLLRERVRALEEQIDQIKAEQESQVPEEIPLDLETKVHGYADIGFVAYTPNLEPEARALCKPDCESARPPGFQVGDLVVSYVANLDRRVTVTTDLVFGLEHLGDWLSNLDRLHIEFDISDQFRISAGKLQSPFGYWNTNIPYGSYLYAPYSRPFVLQFERHGSTIATRQTGVDVHGQLALGYWRWGYHVGISNGRAPHLVQTQDIGDGSWFKTTWVQLWIESPNGIQLGLTGAYDPVRIGRMSMDYSEDVGDQGDVEMVHSDPENPALTQDVDEYLGVAHLAWQGDNMQLLGEVFFVAHRYQTGPGTTEVEYNRDAYVQWSHEYGKSTPYVRVDYVEWWKDDPIYQDLGKLKTQGVATVGVRRDVALHAALKGEGYLQYEQRYVDPDSIDDPLDPGANEAEDRIRAGGGLYLTVGF